MLSSQTLFLPQSAWHIFMWQISSAMSQLSSISLGSLHLADLCGTEDLLGSSETQLPRQASPAPLKLAAEIICSNL